MATDCRIATKSCAILLLFCFLAAFTLAVDTNYMVGAGIYDVTGPASEINMVGGNNNRRRRSSCCC